ncbi:winged helix-turn-helix domain-containing protein [Rahnella aquatilis]|uniref:winged helix-turn-helix domain-containing protein n=1 Tax=Rahnella aquatilis TaxID=34038 RepID=UPI00068CD231|nr:winged helix-turn-helix domain-containing protein [Rahnella aquatilis]
MNNKFIINDIICFDADDFTVTCMNDDSCRCLAGVKGRCFQVLLESNNNEVITKKQLHFSVWEKFGFYSNDNCLLQTIYSLRKELKQLGLDDIILTSPRVGYKINPNYEVSISTDKFIFDRNHQKANVNSLPLLSNDPPVENMTKESKLQFSPILILSIIVFIIFSIFLVIYLSYQNHDVYLIGNQKDFSKLEVMNKSKKINILKYLQSCETSHIYFADDTNLFFCNSELEPTSTKVQQ